MHSLYKNTHTYVYPIFCVLCSTDHFNSFYPSVKSFACNQCATTCVFGVCLYTYTFDVSGKTGFGVCLSVRVSVCE